MENLKNVALVTFMRLYCNSIATITIAIGSAFEAKMVENAGAIFRDSEIQSLLVENLQLQGWWKSNSLHPALQERAAEMISRKISKDPTPHLRVV